MTRDFFFRIQAGCLGAAARHGGRALIAAALAVALGGCAGSMGNAASVTGNEQGGKVPYAEGGIGAAGDAAKAHCSQYGKKAAITQMTPSDGGGGTVGFQCR
jgi:hypothetical protein